MSLQSAGTYTRLPSAITEFFVPRPPLNPSSVLDTVERLNEHTLYRLRCVDYVPPDLIVDRVADGRVYVHGGGESGWVAQLSLGGFEDDSRWWLTGVEWAWQVDGARTGPKTFTPEERQQILDLCNLEILVPKEAGDVKEGMDVEGDAAGTSEQEKVDSPLVRVYNFLRECIPSRVPLTSEHLSLAYQLEVLYSQALTMAQGRWRGQLQVEIDRGKKELRLRYWM